MEPPARVDEGRSSSSLKMFTVLPAPELREYIECYYGEETIIREFGNPLVPHRLILPPLACVEMHFCYNDTSLLIRAGNGSAQFHDLIIGDHNIYTHYVVDNFKEVAKQIHVKFRPGGFFELFGVPEFEIRDAFFDVNTVLGDEANKLQDNINNACSTKERIGILDRFFHRRLTNHRDERWAERNAWAVKWIIRNRGDLRVAELFRHMGVTKRTLERHFLSRFGLSPKEFARVVRFKMVLSTLLSSVSVDWQELVSTYGYYDQSHLINEFREATTFSPELFLRQKGRTVINYKTGIFLTPPLDQQPIAYQAIMRQASESEPDTDNGGR